MFDLKQVETADFGGVPIPVAGRVVLFAGPDGLMRGRLPGGQIVKALQAGALVRADELAGPFVTTQTNAAKLGALACTITTDGAPVMLTFRVVVQKTGENANAAICVRRNGQPIGLEFIIPASDQSFNYKMGSYPDTPPAGTWTYEFWFNVEDSRDQLNTVSGDDPRFSRFIAAQEVAK